MITNYIITKDKIQTFIHENQENKYVAELIQRELYIYNEFISYGIVSALIDLRMNMEHCIMGNFEMKHFCVDSWASMECPS